MSTRRQPGAPTARALEAQRAYLEMGPGRSIGRLLEVLQRRAEIARKPPLCTRINTLELWSRQYHWRAAALAYDAEMAQRRHQALCEEEQRQAQDDTKTLVGAVRGLVAVATMALHKFVDPQTGDLRRTDLDVRDIVLALKLGMEMRHWLDARPTVAPLQPGLTEVEVLLREGNITPDQRLRILQTMHQLNDVLAEVRGER